MTICGGCELERLPCISATRRSLTLPRKMSEADAIELGYPMTIKEDAPPPVVGVYWIDEADYPALRNIFDDGDKMPPTWKAWLKMAEEMKRGLNPTATSSCAFASSRTAFPNGAPAIGRAMARDRVVKHERVLTEMRARTKEPRTDARAVNEKITRCAQNQIAGKRYGVPSERSLSLGFGSSSAPGAFCVPSVSDQPLRNHRLAEIECGNTAPGSVGGLIHA